MIQANTNFMIEREFFGGVIPSIDVERIRQMFDTLRKRISDAYNVTVTEDDTMDLMRVSVDAIRDFYTRNPKTKAERIYIYVSTNARCSEYRIDVCGDRGDDQIIKQTADYDLAKQQEIKEFDETWGFTPIDDKPKTPSKDKPMVESSEMFWDRVVHKQVPKGLELNIEQGDAYVWVGVPKRNIAFFQLESTKRAMRDIPEPTPESTRLEAKCINLALRIASFINKFKNVRFTDDRATHQ